MKTSALISKAFLVLSFVFLIVPAVSYAQKGFPFVAPFSFDESIESENFDIVQDNNQNILIANRKGILTFDSRVWDLLPLPYFPSVLTKSTADGTVYAGCRNGFGLLELDVTGKYIYRLLSDTIVTGEISDIRIAEDRVYFIARNRIFYTKVESGKLNQWEFPYENEISGSFVFKDDFYFMAYGKGLYKAENDTFRLVLADRLSTRSKLVFAVEAEEKKILVGTDNNKLFLFNGTEFSPISIDDAEYLNTSNITDGVYLGGFKIAIGSMMGGVLICDYKTGITSSILNYKTGLPDDEIFCLGTDTNQGLWLCHSFGISRIDNQLSVSNLTWYPGLSGNLTNIAYFNNQLYVGTSDGLYLLKEKREYKEKIVPERPAASTIITDFPEPIAEAGRIESSPTSKRSRKEQRKSGKESKIQTTSDVQAPAAQQAGFLEKIISSTINPVKSAESNSHKKDLSGIKKKVYALQTISHSYEKVPGLTGKCSEIVSLNDHLMVSTYNGLHSIRNNQVKTVLQNTFIGFLDPGPGDTLLFAGSGKSLFVLQLKENNWEIIHEFDALDYPVYSACMTSPTELWLGSDNSAHKLTIDSDFYTDLDETVTIPAKFSDKVILEIIDNQLYFFLSSGIFKMANNQIQAVKTFDKLFSLPEYHFSDRNTVWLRSEGYWDYISDSSTGKNLPEEYLNIFQSIEDIYLGNEGELYVIANNHEIFKILNDPKKTDSDGFTFFFTGLKDTDDHLFSLIKPKISHKNSSLRIDFSAPYYIAPGKTEFSYRIQGLVNDWTPWSTVSAIEYPLLPPGEYSIQAKARNIFGKESGMGNLDIVIKPPFHKTIVFYLLTISLIIAFFIFVLKFREQNLKKAKQVLEQKVSERTLEIEKQKNEISEQKKEITDSILYAKRIQTAVLPSTSMLNSVLSEHFVLFLPKDIVSGDFYWSAVKGDKIVILAADCTGHGVPGAFMSMLGISFLNEIVNAHNLDNASTVLDALRNHVKSTLNRSDNATQSRDGMDIALCIIDQKKMKLQFAGAYNPLYMLREGEITEFKGDKMPIGLYELDKEFTNNSINIKKDDCFYMFSDGFIDQFGGKNEKKYLTRQFKELLVQINPQPMTRQKEMLTTAFLDWKGCLQQVDDVLVIGIRI